MRRALGWAILGYIIIHLAVALITERIRRAELERRVCIEEGY